MKRKSLIIMSLVMVLALCVGCLVACNKGLNTEQLDKLYKEFTKEHRNDAQESAISYWVGGEVSYLDDDANKISANVKWTIEGTTLVTVGETPNNLGQYQIIVPDEVDEVVNYKLVGTLVDGSGKAYTDKDGKEYKLEISKTIPAGKGQGTEESPYSVTGALAEFATIAADGWSTEKTYIKGIVVTAPTFNSSHNSYAFYMADSKEATNRIQVYSGSLASGVEAPCQNDTVVVNGFYMNYRGNNPELTGSTKDPVHDYPVIISRVVGTSQVSYLPNENADITLGKTSGENGETFTFTVVAKNNATISSVKVNGEVVTATSGNEYTGTIKGDTEVSVVALLPTTGEQTANVNLETNFASYAADWAGTYTAQTIDSAALGVSNMNLEIAFERVSKQSTTITTMPVFATNNNTKPTYTTISLKDGKHIKSITFEFQMWSTSKKFKTVALDYTTDGTTWTPVDGVGARDLATAVTLEGYTTLSATNLPANVIAVRIVLLGGYDSGNQSVGFKSFTIVAE